MRLKIQQSIFTCKIVYKVSLQSIGITRVDFFGGGLEKYGHASTIKKGREGRGEVNKVIL